ncbi:unnamed protein product [Effrenium voratum]|nr:unnamed protein product [Effrenium voratum]CAJ1456776.1 unnamed protein product [Effrenium voratum]
MRQAAEGQLSFESVAAGNKPVSETACRFKGSMGDAWLWLPWLVPRKQSWEPRLLVSASVQQNGVEMHSKCATSHSKRLAVLQPLGSAGCRSQQSRFLAVTAIQQDTACLHRPSTI